MRQLICADLHCIMIAAHWELQAAPQPSDDSWLDCRVQISCLSPLCEKSVDGSDPIAKIRKSPLPSAV
jgi:hypothetical protein